MASTAPLAPACAGCHRKLDPPGFVLEAFDPIGRHRTHYRTTETGEKLPDGLWDDVLEAVKEVERRAAKGFGDAANAVVHGEKMPKARPGRCAGPHTLVF